MTPGESLVVEQPLASTPQPKALTSTKQLLVEGRDDSAFFLQFLKYENLADIQIQIYEGRDNLFPFLKALKIAPGFLDQVVSIGIVRDADTNPQGAFDSVCGCLRSAQLPVPDQPRAFAGTDPKMGVLILPDDSSPGMLETMCLASVANDPALSCVDAYFECIQEQGNSLPGNMSKARLQAFLASRLRPGLLLGQAVAAGYLDLSNPAFDQVRDFLRAL